MNEASEHPFVGEKNDRKPSMRRVLVLSFLVFVALTFVLISIDVYPEPTSTALADEQMVLSANSMQGFAPVAPTATAGIEVPLRIKIDAINVDASIENPESTEITQLDSALLNGVVHYPGSGNLDDNTNMFLFGHSSGLPVIHNPNFKVFNGLSELESGNLIRIQSTQAEYVYRVTRVRLTNTQEAYVEFDTGKKQLTLSTCNSFGDKSERWVVEADFVGSYPL